SLTQVNFSSVCRRRLRRQHKQIRQGMRRRKSWVLDRREQWRIGPIGEQAASGDEGAIEVDRGQLVPRRKRDDQIAMKQRPPARGHDQTPGTSLIQIMATDLLWLCCYRGGFNVSKNPLTSPEGRENREPLEVTIKIKIDRKNADALVRLLIKQRDEILSVAESVEYIPYTPMEWLKKAGF
ncbi:MAG: hypothetical protein WA723_19875, partial [Pseudolabrys sp.]